MPSARAALSSLLSLLLILPAAAPAQEQRDPEPTVRPAFDLDYRVKDPMDLVEPSRRFHDRWRRIHGVFGTRYHLYPAQQAGRRDGPLRLFSGGWNYSLWRDPVTGWPDF